ncbi:MAG: hypothetical protein ACPG4Z_00935 [Chitinophagales bacterium]
MRKISLFILASIIFVTYSCNNTTEEVVDVVEEETTVVEEVIEEVEEVTATDLPTFESEEMTAFIGEYDALVVRTIDMLKAGDFEGMAALEEEGNALTDKVDGLLENASEADQATFVTYITSKEEEIQAAMATLSFE